MNVRALFSSSFPSTITAGAFFITVLYVMAASPLSGQEFRVEVIGGTPITSNFAPSTTVYPGDQANPPSIFTIGSGPRSFIAGLSLGALITSRLSIEADVLHRNLWANWIYTLNPGSTAATSTTNQFVESTTWEFPILLKYTMGGNQWHPFVDGGISIRSLERTGAPGPSRRGLTCGAGVAFEFGRFELTPQLRYTRWASSESNGLYDVKRDQVELLTGLAYRLPAVMRFGDQRIAVGVLGGSRLNETLAGAPYRLNRRALGGISLDANVRSNFSIEVNGIYKPIGISKNSVLTWEFPVLLKHYRDVRGTRLLAEAGPSFRASGNLQSSIPPSSFGFTVGGGIEKKVNLVRIAPALRYSRWSERGTYNPNSIDVLLGVSF